MSETDRIARDGRRQLKKPCDRCGNLIRAEDLKAGLCGGCYMATPHGTCPTCGDLDPECPDCTEPVA